MATPELPPLEIVYSNDQVKFGETTVEEMCYSFTMYYPKVQQALWSWALPAVTSTCQ